jgi:RNA polymerase sigma-70 factor (ECF subfamily)
LDKETEIQLARDLIDGQPEAFDRFVEHFRAKIFQYSWLMCGHREDAEEVSQETLLRVFENFGQLRQPERVRPWVLRIAKNFWLMKRRRSQFAPARVKLEIADWSSMPEDRMLRAELRGVLDHAIAGLPETYRAVILLRDVEELSTDETAQLLDLSVDAIKTRLHRARLAIRQELDGYLKTREVSAHVP